MVGVHKCYKRLVLNMAMPQNAHESLADLVLKILSSTFKCYVYPEWRELSNVYT